MSLTKQQQDLCTQTQWDFSDLKAVFLNCTLKKRPERSHTQGLIDISSAIMRKSGVVVEVVRPVDLPIATGVWPDMTEYGWEADAWPELYKKVRTGRDPRHRYVDLARR